jgi:hypothetical protein
VWVVGHYRFAGVSDLNIVRATHPIQSLEVSLNITNGSSALLEYRTREDTHGDSSAPEKVNEFVSRWKMLYGEDPP